MAVDLRSHMATDFPERIVLGRGIGGQRANQIAMRQGGLGFTITIDGNQIVAGANTVTAFNGVALAGCSTISDSTQNQMLLSTASDNTTRSLTVEIAGITGILTRTATGGPPSTAETYTFTPDAGQPVPVSCPADSPVTVLAGLELNYTFCYWDGRNNKELDNWSVVSYVQDMIDHLAVQEPRGAVLSIINGNYADEFIGQPKYLELIAANEELATAFPDFYVDVRRYLIDDGLADLGITPTAQDLTDIANDIVPSSLRTDNIHLTAAANGLVSDYVKAQIFIPNGW